MQTLVKVFIIAILTSTLSMALDTAIINVKIDKITDKDITFYSNASLRVGQSGIVLTTIDDNDVIIASAEILTSSNGEFHASYDTFSNIAQKYLPTPRATPKEGDKIIFNSFYDKSIAIAPNQEIYNRILSLSPNIHFMHIDLFGAFLAKDGINDPKKKHFRRFCNAYSVGLLHIFASNGINVLDCQSFAILEIIPLQKPTLDSTDAPFFSRIININTGSLMSKLRSKKSRKYFSYYDDLLENSIKSLQGRDNAK